MLKRKLFKNFDYTILIIVLVLIGIGLLMITSATSSITSGGNEYSFVKKQTIAFIIGIVLMTIVLFIDYNVIGKYFWYFYGLSIVMLLLVIFFGTEINGAKSWFKFGSFSLQPSEVSKIFIIIFMARFIANIKQEYTGNINSPKYLILIAILSAVPLLLICLQPDLGTAMVIVIIIGVMLFAAGLSYKYFFAAGLLSAISIPLLWIFKLEEYQKDRIKVFLNPDSDPLNRGFQVIQSKIAIGSGGFWGKGLFQGIQTQLGFLPFKETDFIFSVIGEELGFFWCMIILLLYGVLLLKLIDIVRKSKDFFGSMLVVGIVAMIGIHVFQNIGMTVGLAPITGIPLPFISYGGSSLLVNMVGIGLALSVSMRKQKITF